MIESFMPFPISYLLNHAVIWCCIFWATRSIEKKTTRIKLWPLN
jgi:hypothetical protein